MNAYYLAAPDGRFYYPLPEDNEFDRRSSGTWDGELIGDPSAPRYRPIPAWLAVPEPTDSLIFRPAPRSETVGYRLKDQSAASEKYPAEIVPDLFKELDQELRYGLYDAVQVDVPVAPIIYDVSAMVEMPGEPDPRPGIGWEPSKAHVLVYGATVGHLLPGVLTGVRAEVGARIEAQFGDRHKVYTHDSSKISVHLSFDYDVPVFTTRQNTSRATGKPLRGTTKVRIKVTSMVDIHPPWTIEAPTKAEAVAKLDALCAEYVDLLNSYQPVACSHCKGNGYVAEREVQS